MTTSKEDDGEDDGFRRRRCSFKRKRMNGLKRKELGTFILDSLKDSLKKDSLKKAKATAIGYFWFFC
jgi:hypothetical protein